MRAPLTELTDVEKRRLKDWTASDSWVQRFGQRNNLVSVALHGAAGDVDLSDPGLVKRIAEIKETCAKFSLQCVYNVDEFGLFYRCLPRRTYLAPSESSTKRKRRGARGTKQTRMKGANVNEHCLAACAEAQRTVADENAKSLLEEWQQFDDSQAVVDRVLAEFADEIGSNDEPEEILELDDDDNEEDVIEQPAASMSGVKAAAARAIHSVKTVTSSELNPCRGQKSNRSSLRCMHGATW